METQKDIVTPHSLEVYYANSEFRVKEGDMSTSEEYSFITELSQSSLGLAGEFYTRLEQVRHLQIGRAALILSLFDPSTDSPLATLNAKSENGFITPETNLRIAHPSMNIGVISQGYLLGPNEAAALQHGQAPRTVDERAMHGRSFDDTRTSVLELNNILLGYN